MSDDEAEPVLRVPTARVMFSGENSPATLALRWCGWNTLTPIDIIHGPSHDLSKSLVQETIQSSEATVDAWLAGIDCTTQTKARERPIPGVQNPPTPLRDELHLDGVAGAGRRAIAESPGGQHCCRLVPRPAGRM